jgi:hypothetical protein
MKYKKFKKLAKKHLFVLEGCTYDKKGNKEKQIYGLDELYKQLNLTDVGCSLCIDDDSADILVEKIYKENKEDLQYLTDKEGIFKAGLAHGLLSKIRLHE